MRAIVNRLLAAIPALAGVIVITFMLTRVLPGGHRHVFRWTDRDRRVDCADQGATRSRPAAL